MAIGTARLRLGFVVICAANQLLLMGMQLNAANDLAKATAGYSTGFGGGLLTG